MADTIQITPGVGVVVATDDCASQGHVQIMKLAGSGDGIATPIPTDPNKGLFVNVAGFDISPPLHSFGFAQVNKNVRYTTARTGTALWTPATAKKIVVQNWQLSCKGAAQADIQLWFGAAADTTFTTVTDSALYDGGYTPSQNGRTNIMMNGMWISPTIDYVLRITTSADVDIRINIWGYEF